MHSISPYLVRIRNKNTRDNLELHNINFLSLLNNFIQIKNSLSCDNGANQAYFLKILIMTNLSVKFTDGLKQGVTELRPIFMIFIQGIRSLIKRQIMPI